MMPSIKKNFFYNALYQMLVLFIPLITTPYISRTLGAEGIGIYSYSFSVAQYFALFIMLGLNNYGNRKIAQSRDNSDLLRHTFWSIYAMQICIGLIVLVLYLFYVVLMSKNLAASVAMVLYVASACIDINWFFFGMEQFKITVTRNTIIKIMSTISVFLFVRSSKDVYLYCVIVSGGAFVSQLLLWPFVNKICRFYLPKWAEIKVHFKPNLILFLTVIAVSVYRIMDKIMLGSISGMKEVGYYESSEKIVSVPISLVSALGTVMLPRISNLKNKKTDLDDLLYKSILFAMFLSSSISFGIMAVSDTFVPLFYGPGYEKCIIIYKILLPSSLFFSFGNVIRTQYLLPNEMDKVYVKSAFYGAIINIIINTIAIPRYGSAGASFGTLVSEMSVCIYQAYKVKNNININKYIRESLPFILSGLIMFLLISNINIQTNNEICLLLLKIVIGGIVYFIVLITQLIFKKEQISKFVVH